MIDKIEMIRRLESELKYTRFVHTMGVAYTASSLAMRYGEDIHKAETAGLLHDCAKCLDLKKMQKVCDKAGEPITDLERNSTSLLHSKAGSVLAAKEYGVTDPDILNAIRYHTTGRPGGMSLLEKIIFIADYIEPGRDQAEDLDIVRPLAFRNIDQTMITILRDTLDYLDRSGAKVDPMTQKTYEFFAGR